MYAKTNINNNQSLNFKDVIDWLEELKKIKKQVIFLKDDLEEWFIKSISANRAHINTLFSIPVIVSKDIAMDIIGIFKKYDEVIIVDDKKNIKVINKDILNFKR